MLYLLKRDPLSMLKVFGVNLEFRFKFLFICQIKNRLFFIFYSFTNIRDDNVLDLLQIKFVTA